MLILERPHSSDYVILLARSNGVYDRPIAGRYFDVRVEDFMPLAELGITTINFIGQLPNSRRFLVSTFNTIQTVDATQELVDMLLSKTDPTTNNPFYVLLPSNPGDKYYELINCPWWEYAVVYDEYDGHIKAPKRPRTGEPSAADIDERLDDYPENQGKVDVLSPETLDKWVMAGVTEDFEKRLRRV